MFFCDVSRAGARKSFGDSAKREAVRNKLATVFESLKFPERHPPSCAYDDYNKPCWAALLSVDPYDWRAYQYRNKYVEGFGAFEDRLDDCFTGDDGTGDEPTQYKLYEIVIC